MQPLLAQYLFLFHLIIFFNVFLLLLVNGYYNWSGILHI